METVYIYGLSSSCDVSNIRYIGKTSGKIESRLDQHIRISKRNIINYKDAWIRKEIKNGYKILIKQIDCVYSTDWQFWEMYYISKYKKDGYKLTNTSPGGGVSVLSRSVTLLDMHGNFIKEFNSKAAAARYMDVDIKYLENVLNRKTNRIFTLKKKFQPIFTSDYDVNKNYNRVIDPDKYKKKTREQKLLSWKNNGIKGSAVLSKPVIQYDINMNFIREFSSAREAGRYFGLKKATHIYENLNGRAKTYRGFIFKYKLAHS